MNLEEAKGILAYQYNMKDTDVYTPINYEAIYIVLKELERLENNSCLRCEDGKPAYCEKCFQDVIKWNARMQQELNEENLRCAKFAMENYDLKEKLRYKDLYG